MTRALEYHGEVGLQFGIEKMKRRGGGEAGRRGGGEGDRESVPGVCAKALCLAEQRPVASVERPGESVVSGPGREAL